MSRTLGAVDLNSTTDECQSLTFSLLPCQTSSHPGKYGSAAILDQQDIMAIAKAIEAPRKVCFVTIGATASFDALLEAVLTRTFFETLEKLGYTDLVLQYGKDGLSILESFRQSEEHVSISTSKINISGFDFNKQGLGQEMRAAKGENGDLEGVVISHAGMITENWLFSWVLSQTFAKALALSLTLFASPFRSS